MTDLIGPLRYLIGADGAPAGKVGEVIEVSYDVSSPPHIGGAIAYCNLFDEKNTGEYGPYLNDSDTAHEYDEGQIDPKGRGWHKNLTQQFSRRKTNGFQYVELDNADSYHWPAVKDAINLAAEFNLRVVAKNPEICEHSLDYVAHPNIYGIIVERGAGTCNGAHKLRIAAHKPQISVWFVAFGSGRGWADQRGAVIKANAFRRMGVTYSSRGEYGNSIDIYKPVV